MFANNSKLSSLTREKFLDYCPYFSKFGSYNKDRCEKFSGGNKAVIFGTIFNVASKTRLLLLKANVIGEKEENEFWRPPIKLDRKKRRVSRMANNKMAMQATSFIIIHEHFTDIGFAKFGFESGLGLVSGSGLEEEEEEEEENETVEFVRFGSSKKIIYEYQYRNSCSDDNSSLILSPHSNQVSAQPEQVAEGEGEAIEEELEEAETIEAIKAKPKLKSEPTSKRGKEEADNHLLVGRVLTQSEKAATTCLARQRIEGQQGLHLNSFPVLPPSRAFFQPARPIPSPSLERKHKQSPRQIYSEPIDEGGKTKQFEKIAQDESCEFNYSRDDMLSSSSSPPPPPPLTKASTLIMLLESKNQHLNLEPLRKLAHSETEIENKSAGSYLGLLKIHNLLGGGKIDDNVCEAVHFEDLEFACYVYLDAANMSSNLKTVVVATKIGCEEDVNVVDASRFEILRQFFLFIVVQLKSGDSSREKSKWSLNLNGVESGLGSKRRSWDEIKRRQRVDHFTGLKRYEPLNRSDNDNDRFQKCNFSSSNNHLLNRIDLILNKITSDNQRVVVFKFCSDKALREKSLSKAKTKTRTRTNRRRREKKELFGKNKAKTRQTKAKLVCRGVISAKTITKQRASLLTFLSHQTTCYSSKAFDHLDNHHYLLLERGEKRPQKEANLVSLNSLKQAKNGCQVELKLDSSAEDYDSWPLLLFLDELLVELKKQRDCDTNMMHCPRKRYEKSDNNNNNTYKTLVSRGRRGIRIRKRREGGRKRKRKKRKRQIIGSNSATNSNQPTTTVFVFIITESSSSFSRPNQLNLTKAKKGPLLCFDRQNQAQPSTTNYNFRLKQPDQRWPSNDARKHLEGRPSINVKGVGNFHLVLVEISHLVEKVVQFLSASLKVWRQRTTFVILAQAKLELASASTSASVPQFSVPNGGFTAAAAATTTTTTTCIPAAVTTNRSLEQWSSRALQEEEAANQEGEFRNKSMKRKDAGFGLSRIKLAIGNTDKSSVVALQRSLLLSLLLSSMSSSSSSSSLSSSSYPKTLNVHSSHTFLLPTNLTPPKLMPQIDYKKDSLRSVNRLSKRESNNRRRDEDRNNINNNLIDMNTRRLIIERIDFLLDPNNDRLAADSNHKNYNKLLVKEEASGEREEEDGEEEEEARIDKEEKDQDYYWPPLASATPSTATTSSGCDQKSEQFEAHSHHADSSKIVAIFGGNLSATFLSPDNASNVNANYLNEKQACDNFAASELASLESEDEEETNKGIELETKYEESCFVEVKTGRSDIEEENWRGRGRGRSCGVSGSKFCRVSFESGDRDGDKDERQEVVALSATESLWYPRTTAQRQTSHRDNISMSDLNLESPQMVCCCRKQVAVTTGGYSSLIISKDDNSNKKDRHRKWNKNRNISESGTNKNESQEEG